MAQIKQPDRRSVLQALAAAPLLSGPAQSALAGGTLVEMPDLPSFKGERKQVTVWLPPGYDAEVGHRYPVLYMQDGQGLFDQSRPRFGGWRLDEHLVPLIADGGIRAPIVAGIWNTSLRSREYMPEEPVGALPAETQPMFAAQFGGSPLSEPYLRFVVDYLKPTMDRRFRTLTGPADTLIGGGSLGAQIACHAVLKHPEVFGAAMCVSTAWAGGRDDEAFMTAWTDHIRANLPPARDHRFYFDRGDKEPLADFQARVDQVFAERGYGPERFQSLTFPRARHSEADWSRRLDIPLRFLLSR